MRLYKRKPDKDKIGSEEKIKLLEKEKKELSELVELKSKLEIVARSVLEMEDIGTGMVNYKENTITLSETAKNILGLKTRNETIQTEDFLSIVSSEDKAGVKSILINTEKQKKQVFSYKIVKPDEDKEVCFISSKIIHLENPDVIIFSISDITKQEKIKKELTRAKEKAEESDKAKNIFLTNVSHEIRVPMNSIVGFAELINIGNISPDERKEYIKIIKNQSNHLLKFIDDISEIAKFEAGEIKLNKTACNLNLLLNELFVYFIQHRKQLKKDQVEIKLSIPEKKGVIISTDTGRLHQLLTNLLTNAFKYTEKGLVEFGYLNKEGKIEFFVKDTGVGLTKEEQKHIFDRFKISEETLTRKYEGSGLGLSIAKGIVKLLGGKIWIESEPGKGSSFYFNIPFEQVPEMETSSVEEENSLHKYNWKGKIMLVVEDDEVNFKFIEALLTENQAKVLRANNGLQAIELFKTITKIDIILMDIKMPQMDGFEATRQIKKINSSIPVIAQTAYASDEDKEKCFNAGCNDQVSKPIDIDELLSKINKLITF